MRITRSVYIAHGAIDDRRDIQHPHIRRRCKEPRLAGQDRRVVGFSLHHRQPAIFQPGAGRHDQVGATRIGDQRRPRLNAVRILQPGRRRIDLHLVATERLRQCAPLRYRGKNLQIGVS